MSFLTQRGPMPVQRQVDQRPVAPVANRYAERPGQSTTNVMGTGPVNNVAGVNMYGQQAPQQSAAQAYFAANPDVQRAFQQNSYGMTPDQFAETHYRNFGQTEGRQWNGQGAIAPPNFSAMTGGQYGNSQQPSMGLLNMTPHGSVPPVGGPNQAQMLAYQQAAAARQQQNPGSPMQPGPWAGSAAQPAGQPPAWLQPYLGGAMNQAAQPGFNDPLGAQANQIRNQQMAYQQNAAQNFMQNNPALAQSMMPNGMVQNQPIAAQQSYQGPQRPMQPQALGQSTSYSPATRPASPWYGGGGVNI